MLSEFSVTIVIPTYNDSQFLEKILWDISKQTFLPKEIVIIDSSTNDGAKKILENYDDLIPVTYHYEKKAYPGKARNIGVDLANSEWVAFLDSKTLPEIYWLDRYRHLLQAYGTDVIFGVTQFEAVSPFQKTLRAATYGMIGHHTVPGTLINKKVFTDSGGFLEHVRMGEDIEWRERLIKNGFNIHLADESVVSYHGLPATFISTLTKYVKSAYHTARLSILRNVKDAYLSLLLILSAILLPKWNFLIGGWDTNPLFIPHVTKIYMIALVFLFLSYQLIHYLFFRNISQSLYSRALQVIVLIFVTLAVFNWNAVIAGWVEDAVLYVPHITKMYVGGVILTSILYRGILLPLKRKVKIVYLFPVKWIKVGLLGLSLDLVKGPFYLAGAVIGMFNILFDK